MLRHSIERGLEQLIRLREGQFNFSLTETIPPRVGARDITEETLPEGINAQELLLDLARGMDEDRRDSTAALEASFAEAPPGGWMPEARGESRAAPPDRRAPPAAPATPAPRPAPAPEPTRAAGTVLLVDDEDEVRRILAERFTRGRVQRRRGGRSGRRR